VWPRYVHAIRKINLCKRPLEVSNVWYNFIPYEASCWSNPSWCASWLGGNCRLTSETRTPTFSSIFGDGRTVRAYPSTPLDNNKTITFFGEDTNGQPLTTRGTGGWSDGIKLSLRLPYAETTINVRNIDRVLKDSTQGPVRVYAWDTANSVLEDLAVYQGNETNPAYLRTQLSGGGCCDSGGCPTSQSVVALTKLRYVPVQNDTDPVLISNLDALQLMVQSLKSEDAVDRETARQYETDAIREANLELFDDNADDTIPVSNDPFHGTGIGRQRVF
jgi:hypothetical protein